MMHNEIREYITSVILDHGGSLDDEIELEIYPGYTWSDLLDFLEPLSASHPRIVSNLKSTIDQGGGVFEFLSQLALVMVGESPSCG